MAYEITRTLPEFEVVGNPDSSSENVINFNSISKKTLNFLKKYHKKTDIHSLTKKEAVRVIESLKNVLEHERTKKEKDPGNPEE